MKKQFFFFLWLLLNLCLGKLSAQTTQRTIIRYIGPPKIVSFQKLMNSANEVAKSNQNISVIIENARKNYYDALKKGINTDQVAESYFNKLFGKDFLYYQQFSYDRAIYKGEKRNKTSIAVLFGDIDNGIYPHCREAFDRWVDTVDYHLGILVNGNLFAITSENYIKALDRSAETYASYCMIRDWVDHEKNGIKYPGTEGTKAYAMAMINGYSGKSGMELNAKYYQTLVDVFGEAHVLQVFEKYRNAPKKENSYELDTYETAVSLGMYSSLIPYSSIQNMLGRGDGFKYILGNIYDGNKDLRKDWKKVLQYYRLFEMAYGAEKVKTLGQKLWEVPKQTPIQNNGELILDPTSLHPENTQNDPYKAFQEVLKINDPEGYFRLQIALYFGFKTKESIDKHLASIYNQYGKDKTIAAVTYKPTAYSRASPSGTRTSMDRRSTNAPVLSRRALSDTTTSSRTPQPSTGRRIDGPPTYETIMDIIAPLSFDFKNDPQFKSINTPLMGGHNPYYNISVGNKGCQDTIDINIRLSSLAKYQEFKEEIPKGLKGINNVVCNWSTHCGNYPVKYVRYHFYLRDTIIRKSFVLKAENWFFLHTTLDVDANGAPIKTLNKVPLPPN